jgi:hypothetical protein
MTRDVFSGLWYIGTSANLTNQLTGAKLTNTRPIRKLHAFQYSVKYAPNAFRDRQSSTILYYSNGLGFLDSKDLYTNSQPQATTQVVLQRVKSRANTLDPENTTIGVDTRLIGQAAQSLFTRLI